MKRHSLLVLILVLISSCATVRLENPQISVISIAPRNTQGLELAFDIELKITNPNGIPLPIKGIGYQIEVNGTPLVQGISNETSTIPARGNIPVNLSANVNILSAPKIFFDFIQNKNKTMNYKLTTDFDLNGILPTLTVVTKGQYPEN